MSLVMGLQPDDAARKAKVASYIVTIGAMSSSLFMTTFMLGLWVGKDWPHPSLYSSEHVWYAVIATVIGVIVGGVDWYISSVLKKSRLMAFSRTFMIFVIIMIDSSSMAQRADDRVHAGSTSSPVFAAVVDSIKASSQASASAAATSSPLALQAAADKAKAQAQYAECKGDSCRSAASSKIAQAQAKIDMDAQQRATGNTAAGNQIASLVGAANSLQYDERHAPAVGKIFGEWLGVPPLKIMFAVSFCVMLLVMVGSYSVGQNGAELSAALALPRRSEAFDVRSGTQDATQSATQDASEPDIQDANQKAALYTIWSEIDAGSITSISVRNDGQIAQTLRAKRFATTNERIKELVDFVVDALLKEHVLIKNPDWADGESNGRRPQFVINPKREIRYQRRT